MAARNSCYLGGKEFVKTLVSQPEFAGGLRRGDIMPAMAGKELADDRGGETFYQL
jgi:hypothetical protein